MDAVISLLLRLLVSCAAAADVGLFELQNLTGGLAVSLELCGGGIGDFGCSQLAKLHNLESLVGAVIAAWYITNFGSYFNLVLELEPE